MTMVTERNTALRSMHDAGLAAWFGGSLMGAIGLNGAAAKAPEQRERLQISSAGWDRWAPVNLAAIGTHLVGAAGLLADNKSRLTGQRGVAAMSAAKASLTAAALAATAYSRRVGHQLEREQDRGQDLPTVGVTEPAATTPAPVRAAQRRQRVAQWAVPALTGALIAVSAFAGEQQRPRSVVRGVAGRLREAILPR
ncbi:hypothetical protein [Dactylosporangium salmoneum]|uniref:ABC-type Mn/Zn transport systems, ATPase component n=1 Tax=Dactylosporangium salmoneum TaxID=53361 RepID=A0ABP5SKW2_9ACTN